MKRKLIILGGGGHAKVLINCLLECEENILGILDSDSNKHKTNILTIPILGSEELLQQFNRQDIQLVNGIGSVGNPSVRNHLFYRYTELGYQFASVIHPSAIIAREVNLGMGVEIMAGAIIQPGCQLGNNVIVNTRATIDHDCVIGHHVHIAPSATLCGNVTVGDNSHIGSNACIIQGKTIGANCMIGAGAVVTRNIQDAEKVKGIPAK